MKQRQFLDVVDDHVAHELLAEAFRDLAPVEETCVLTECYARVLSRDVRAAVDVPGFDRSNMDGFAVRARDTFGALETEPRQLQVLEEQGIAAGAFEADNSWTLPDGHAIPIATGGVMPRGADAVLMVEDSAPAGDKGRLDVFRALVPGANLTGAGSDIGRGETVLHAGVVMGSRESALLAAVGVSEVRVWRVPRVAVVSTGDEVREPGQELRIGEIYDSNSRIICDAVTELGGKPEFLGICPDDEQKLLKTLRPVVGPESPFDMVVLSGGTSKGKGDLNYEALRHLAESHAGSAGIIVHGVSLKPGKPVCIAEIGGKPVAVLPGFPTSAIFTFHEFLAPILLRLAGRKPDRETEVEAFVPVTQRSATGRTEFLLVDLVPGRDGLAAYPLGAGSGSVSTFSRADGFIRIPRHQERIDEGERVSVKLIGSSREPADLVAIGSHCVGLDYLLSQLARRGFRTKSVLVGSLAGLRAQERGEGDISGTHLLDEETGIYNQSFLPEGVRVIGGYGRRQGIVYRSDDERFRGLSADELTALVRSDHVRMVNRNRGSGTRVLLDRLLQGAQPEGFHSEAKSHHSVAAAVAQGRADWGMTLDILARDLDLEFHFLQDEQYDIVLREDHADRPAVRALQNLLEEERTRRALTDLGLIPR